ncbi:MAG: hypothetical protein AB8E15_10060 [Bdellovibrionales bacterium]
MKLIASAMVVLFSGVLLAGPTIFVKWGGEVGMDACDGWGYTKAEATMASKDLETGLTSVSIIPAGTKVTFCDYNSGYHGVLIHEEKVSCGGGDINVPKRTSYDGPCKSGWIKEEFLEFIAG